MNDSDKIKPFPGKRFSETINTGSNTNFSSSTLDNYRENCSTENEAILSDDNGKFMKEKSIISEKSFNIFLGTVAVTIAVLAIVISIAAWTIDKSIDAVNSNVNSKFESINTEIKAINQRMDYQEKINSLMIENEINKNVNHAGK